MHFNSRHLSTWANKGGRSMESSGVEIGIRELLIIVRRGACALRTWIKYRFWNAVALPGRRTKIFSRIVQSGRSILFRWLSSLTSDNDTFQPKRQEYTLQVCRLHDPLFRNTGHCIPINSFRITKSQLNGSSIRIFS